MDSACSMHARLVLGGALCDGDVQLGQKRIVSEAVGAHILPHRNDKV